MLFKEDSISNDSRKSLGAAKDLSLDETAGAGRNYE